MFSVVQFPLENTVAVVSSKWLNKENTETYWPRVSGTQLNKLIFTQALPSTTKNIKWNSYPCQLLKSYDDFEKARKKAKLAEDTSNLESAVDDTPASYKKSKPVAGTSKKRLQFPVLNHAKSSSSSSSQSSDEEVATASHFLSAIPPSQPVTTSVEIQPTDNNAIQPSENIASEVLFNPDTIVIGQPEELDLIRIRLERLEEYTVAKLVAIHDDIKTLLFRTAHLAVSVPTTEGIPDLPIKSSEEFAQLELWLSTIENFAILQKRLSCYGGSTTKNIADRILDELISDALVPHCSFTGKDKSGKKTKIEVKGSNLLKLLEETIRLHKDSTQVTNSVIEGLVQRWIKNKNDALKKKESRKKATVVTTQIPGCNENSSPLSENRSNSA